ncbi:hypothetical protein CAXC1_330094 [Candidatus Xenohaliotis californiensis]|uniref:Uncharacterized protein n=1 Tax=Candidatus Xenohaliotis californiensis TaxID=84677 RepID=A0ABP0EVS6_9RICK|nr:hypothetical protein CAXC1_330094 [Candidatus Xenohaliotis californiensis]
MNTSKDFMDEKKKNTFVSCSNPIMNEFKNYCNSSTSDSSVDEAEEDVELIELDSKFNKNSDNVKFHKLTPKELLEKKYNLFSIADYFNEKKNRLIKKFSLKSCMSLLESLRSFMDLGIFSYKNLYWRFLSIAYSAYSNACSALNIKHSCFISWIGASVVDSIKLDARDDVESLLVDIFVEFAILKGIDLTVDLEADNAINIQQDNDPANSLKEVSSVAAVSSSPLLSA